MMDELDILLQKVHHVVAYDVEEREIYRGEFNDAVDALERAWVAYCASLGDPR